ncbi:hypothetical protein FSARC_3550 [Fusarium sarcochroum]|uniref:Zn(2)-C6 fungal-type domain-containing protein n=1 Tax=Fusarium sarcochroum TaxID=1208366 RepID=A0A8H4U474_9HYPO|nr:hypothetical protein FSARC_3550 [Fusarium sarcochroum]
MAGVPTGRGCDACRKQKKKCDQAKPACTRCARLKIPCAGGGVKRFMFKSENSQAAGKRSRALVPVNASSPPSSGPSNEQSSMTGELVHIIELQDTGYDISTYGWFVKDLPRHIGSSPPLDAAIKAFVASFNTLHNKASEVNALDRYVYALKALRESMQDPAQATSSNNMCSIYLISICQEWMGTTGEGHRHAKHNEVLMHLLQRAILESNLDPSNRHFMQTIFGVVVIESYSNPNVQLGPWFWQAMTILGKSTRPLKSGDGTSFACLDVGTMGEVSYFIRDPDKYLYQIRCTYNLIQHEHPRLVPAVEAAVTNAKRPEATSLERRWGIRFQAAHAVTLTLAIILNRILQSYDNDPILKVDAECYCEEVITLARSASFNRPIAASSMATPLSIAYASMGDYRKSELESLLMEYQSDFPGVNYVADAVFIKERFDNVERRNRNRGRLQELQDAGDFNAESDIMETVDDKPGCIIL